MKYDVMGLLGEAARQISRRDPGRAYALYELANNLRLVLRGKASIDDFKSAYTVGTDSEPFDIEALLPVKP